MKNVSLLAGDRAVRSDKSVVVKNYLQLDLTRTTNAGSSRFPVNITSDFKALPETATKPSISADMLTSSRKLGSTCFLMLSSSCSSVVVQYCIAGEAMGAAKLELAHT